jgi:hypothetical protein
MVGTENILPTRIQSFFVYNFERDADQHEHRLRPPPVKLSYQFELPRKNYWYEQQEEENYEEYKKYYQAV